MADNDSKFDDAAALFESFHGFPPKDRDVYAVTLKEPEVVFTIGELLYVGYIDLSGEKYMHKFVSPRPLLLSSSDGQQLYIGKGRYRFTDRGIA